MGRIELSKSEYILMAIIPFLIRLTVIGITITFSIHFLGIIIGLIISIISLFIFLQFYILLMKFIFKLEYVTGIEKVYITKNPKDGFHIVSCIHFSNYNQEEIYSFICESYICKLKRFRQKLTVKFFEFWFTEVPIEEAKNSIIKLQPFNSEEEIMNYIQIEMNEEIDIFNELPYQIKIAQIGKKEEKKGILIFKFEHIMTDGLGLISALCTTASNYNIESFPSIIKKMKEGSFLETIFFWLLFPFYIIHSSFVFLPMRKYKSPLIPNHFSGNNNIIKGKSYKIKDFENFKKLNKISFNDLMVSVLSKSMYKLINFKQNENYINKNRMRLFLPIARKKLPKSIDEIDLINKTNLVVCDVPIIKDFSNQSLQIIRNDSKKYFKKYIQFAYIKITTLIGIICSWPIFEIAAQALCNRFELAFTNIPGPKSKIYYNGNVIEDLITFITPSRGLPFITLISYNELFNFTLSIDQNCNIKPVEYLKLIENELDELCKESNNIQINDFINDENIENGNEENISELDYHLI